MRSRSRVQDSGRAFSVIKRLNDILLASWSHVITTGSELGPILIKVWAKGRGSNPTVYRFYRSHKRTGRQPQSFVIPQHAMVGRPVDLFPKHHFDQRLRYKILKHLRSDHYWTTIIPDLNELAVKMGLLTIELDFTQLSLEHQRADFSRFSAALYSPQENRASTLHYVLLNVKDHYTRRHYGLAHEIIEFMIKTNHAFRLTFERVLFELDSENSNSLREELINALAGDLGMPAFTSNDIFHKFACEYQFDLELLGAKFKFSPPAIAIQIASIAPMHICVREGKSKRPQVYSSLGELTPQQKQSLHRIEQQLLLKARSFAAPDYCTSWMVETEPFRGWVYSYPVTNRDSTILTVIQLFQQAYSRPSLKEIYRIS